MWVYVIIGTSEWPTKSFPMLSSSLGLFHWFLLQEKSPNESILQSVNLVKLGVLGFVNADLSPSETQLKPLNLSIPFKMKMRKELILMSDVFAAACPVVCGLLCRQCDLPSCQCSVIKPLPRGDVFLCQFQSLKNVANLLRAWQAVLGNASMSREERSKPESKEEGKINLSRNSASKKDFQGCIVFSLHFAECCFPCWKKTS